MNYAECIENQRLYLLFGDYLKNKFYCFNVYEHDINEVEQDPRLLTSEKFTTNTESFDEDFVYDEIRCFDNMSESSIDIEELEFIQKFIDNDYSFPEPVDDVQEMDQHIILFWDEYHRIGGSLISNIEDYSLLYDIFLLLTGARIGRHSVISSNSGFKLFEKIIKQYIIDNEYSSKSVKKEVSLFFASIDNIYPYT